MAVVLINDDNTINFICNKLPKGVITSGLTVKQLPHISAEKLQNNIPNQFCVWDEKNNCIRDEREYPELAIENPKYNNYSDEEKKEYIRLKRNTLLKEVDKVVSNPLRWEELGENIKEEIKHYRKALLNIPQQKGFPDDVVWPNKPDKII